MEASLSLPSSEIEAPSPNQPLSPRLEAVAEHNPCTTGRPVAYLIVHAIAKRANVGALVRSAVAFGVANLIVIGEKDLTFLGAFGADRFLTVRRFPRLRDASDWLQRHGVAVCGIELAAGALPIASHPFNGDVAFLAGNEGDGIPLCHRALCDFFVYVPQYSTGTASLNVATATAIVMSHFAAWAQYVEAPRDPSGREKFAVEAPTAKRGPTTSLDFQKRNMRMARATAATAAIDSSSVGHDAQSVDSHAFPQSVDDQTAS